MRRLARWAIGGLVLLALGGLALADTEQALERSIRAGYEDLSADYETYAARCFGTPLFRELQTRHQQAWRQARKRDWALALALLRKNDRVLAKALSGLAAQLRNGGARIRLAHDQGRLLRQRNQRLIALHWELLGAPPQP